MALFAILGTFAALFFVAATTNGSIAKTLVAMAESTGELAVGT